jgi:hypothetical protein
MFLAAFKSRLMGTLGLQWSHTFSLPAVPGHTYGGGGLSVMEAAAACISSWRRVWGK